MAFIKKDFMITSETGQHLYKKYAKDLPIYDYHCHLSPELIATDYQFEDITDVWLSGDHYKWRALRANGVPESHITGKETSAKEKFMEWAQTVPNTVGNPLFHWTALELKRYFDIDDILTADNGEEIFDQLNKQIQEKKMTTRYFINQSNVALIGTTDSPEDSLEFHQQIAEDDSFKTKVVPSFRPDKALKVNDPAFNEYVQLIGKVADKKVNKYQDFVDALAQRIAFFDSVGTVASDHALEEVNYVAATNEEIEVIFAKGLKGDTLTAQEVNQYTSRLLVDLAKLYADYDWAMQIHFGALRNNNTKMFETLGPDTGFDSIRDSSNDASGLNRLFDAMNQNNGLPKMIIYPLNPTQYDVIGSALANFQSNDKGIKSKLQLGSGWWFNDTERGMRAQMAALADQGLLMNFVGMLTDSRSFLSYPRHEYFRRILCQFIGEQVDAGKIPNDESLLKTLVQNICYYNAVNYFTKNTDK